MKAIIKKEIREAMRSDGLLKMTYLCLAVDLVCGLIVSVLPLGVVEAMPSVATMLATVAVIIVVAVTVADISKYFQISSELRRKENNYAN